MTTFTSWDAELYHHGIKGQKWGIRRFQNGDGTLTDAGKSRYLKSNGRLSEEGYKHYSKKYKMAGANRIDERLRSGKNLKQAVRPEKIGKVVGAISSAYLLDKVFNGGKASRLLSQSLHYGIKTAAYKIGEAKVKRSMRGSMAGLSAAKVYKASKKDYSVK